MSRLSFESTETLVYDPVAANRTATRAALYTLGFRHIETVATLDAFLSSIRRRPPDLALCEAQGADAQLCAMIQELRQGSAGFNPFIVIIVTAWDKSTSLVTRVVNSGADDLLLRPFSTTLLSQRIEIHAERRKGFVVTSDYVGPDRRKDVSRPSDVELFEPPNSLKMKAKDRLTADETTQRLDVELRSARDLLNSEKLRRDAFQIAILWRLLQDEIPGSASYERGLAKIGVLARGVARRCADTNVPKAEEWCNSILAAAEGLEAGVDRNASMHLLGHASLSLNQVFQNDRSTDDILSEIDATVAVIQARDGSKLEAQAS